MMVRLLFGVRLRLRIRGVGRGFAGGLRDFCLARRACALRLFREAALTIGARPIGRRGFLVVGHVTRLSTQRFSADRRAKAAAVAAVGFRTRKRSPRGASPAIGTSKT